MVRGAGVQLGASIATATGDPLIPGREADVELDFWAEEAASVVRQNDAFTI
jgi:hypothetical protein